MAAITRRAREGGNMLAAWLLMCFAVFVSQVFIIWLIWMRQKERRERLERDLERLRQAAPGKEGA